MHQRHLLATLAFVVAGVASAESRAHAADPDSPASVAHSEAAGIDAAEAATDFIEEAERDPRSEEEVEQSAAFDKAYSDYRRALVRNLRESGNPRDWALAAHLGSDEKDGDATAGARAALLNNAALAAPDDIVVQWLWAHSTLAAAGTCGAGGLDPRRVARLISNEPDNAAVWLRQLDLAYAAGDDAAIDDALTHMAASNHFDEHMVELLGAWQQVFLAHPPPTMQSDAGNRPLNGDSSVVAEAQAFGLSMSQALTTLPPMQSLVRVCNAAEDKTGRWERYAVCGDAARRMTHSPVTISRLVGHGVLRKSAQQSPQDFADWRRDRWIHDRFSALPEDAPGIVAFMHEWLARADEFEAMRARVYQAGMPLVPPVQWQPPALWQPSESAAQRTEAPAEAAAD